MKNGLLSFRPKFIYTRNLGTVEQLLAKETMTAASSDVKKRMFLLQTTFFPDDLPWTFGIFFQR